MVKIGNGYFEYSIVWKLLEVFYSFESFVSRNRIDFQGFLSFEYIYIYIFEGIPNFIVKR